MFKDVQAKAVKDVPAEEFIKAYAAHLKSTDKVRGGHLLVGVCSSEREAAAGPARASEWASPWQRPQISVCNAASAGRLRPGRPDCGLVAPGC